MLRISDFSWFVVGAIFSGLHIANAAGIREDIAVVRICNATDPVDLDVFNAYMMHHDFESLESHSTELSCFLLCIYSEYKWMDRHGNFKPHKIKTWMRKANLTLYDREILHHKCIATAELADPCTRARHFTECFWSNHQGTGSLDDDNHTLNTIIKKRNAL